MKLNKLGERVYAKWDNIYNNELKRIRKELNDPDYVDGWCIIEDSRFVKTQEDFVELMLWAYTDGIFNYLDEIQQYEDDDSLYEKRRKLALKYFDFWDTSVYERSE